MKDNTRILSEFASSISFSDIPKKTLDNIRLFYLDYIASSLAGYKINKNFNKAIEKYIYSNGGTSEATSLFDSQKIPCSNAAFLNACYSHGADMDDGNRYAMGHVGSHVFPAVLAMAEKIEAGEQDIATAIIVGYEIYCRVAASAQPGLVARGFHSTGTAGVIACAAACAKLLRLDSDGIYNAMAISVTMASGLMIVAESGQSIKPLNPARAASGGILAAELAKSGIEGGRYPLDSDKGWFHAMSDLIDDKYIFEDLGKKFCIDECYIKPYPSCRHTHCGMQAVLELRNEYDFHTKDIEKVNIYIYANAIKIAGQIKIPQSIDDAKFSIHYAAACMLATGNFTLANLDFTTVPNEISELIDRIILITDHSMEDKSKGIRGCRVEIVLADGSRIEKTVLIPKGDPQNPFTESEMYSKLSSCADGILSKKEQSHLITNIMNFANDNNRKFRGVYEYY
jgi:2-methylcitrate dehydratase PrpD